MPKFRCEQCRQKIAAPDDYVGRRVRCPRCKQAVRVPEVIDGPAEAVAVESASAAPVAPTTSVASTPAGIGPESLNRDIPPRPSAAPFLGQVQDPIFTQSTDADLSSLFGGSEDPASPDHPNDLAPEEQTQTFWHLHEVAGYHDAPDRPFASTSGFRADPVIEEPAAEFRAERDMDESAPASWSSVHDSEPAAAEPEPPPEPEPEPEPEPVILEPTEVIDAPVQRRRPGINSADEVADLLRRLDKPKERARLAAEWVVDRRQRMAPPGSRWIGLLGWMSLLVGLGSIALTFVPAQARYAVPAGVGGMVLALTGLVLALGKRAHVFVPIGGTLVSAAGVIVAVLVAKGLLPPSAGARLLHPTMASPVTLLANTRPASPDGQTPPADYVPATSPVIVKGLELRVVSALVLHPAVYTGDDPSPHTWLARRLQITLELKRVEGGDIVYQPWRNPSEGGAVAQVTDGSGIVLPISERPFAPTKGGPGSEEISVVAVGALRSHVKITPQPVRDVLLFPPPTDASGDLLLDLPGQNIGAPDMTLHLRIPTTLLRVQTPDEPHDAIRP